MPNLSLSFDPKVGPIVHVAVAPPGSEQALMANPIQTFPALVDTGATTTCISKAVADKVGLVPTGKRMMVSASHTSSVNTYLIYLIVPFGVGVPAFGTPITAMEFNPAPTAPFQLLLGRDIICLGIFSIGFDRRFTFSL